MWRRQLENLWCRVCPKFYLWFVTKKGKGICMTNTLLCFFHCQGGQNLLFCLSSGSKSTWDQTCVCKICLHTSACVQEWVQEPKSFLAQEQYLYWRYIATYCGMHRKHCMAFKMHYWKNLLWKSILIIFISSSSLSAIKILYAFDRTQYHWSESFWWVYDLDI